MAQCKECGSENVVLKKGISKKNNKPWAGYKCGDCDAMTFIPMKKSPAPALGASIQHGESGDDKAKSVILSYAKDVVVAEIAKGEVKEPFKRITDGFKALLTAYNYPFGKPKPAPEPEPDINLDEDEPEPGEEVPF